MTELDDFSRICSVSLERSHLLAEKNYHVGVDYDEIKTEETKNQQLITSGSSAVHEKNAE